MNCLTVFDGDLIAAGYFWQAGETAVDNIARWDGVTWSPLGLGTNEEIHSLAVYEGDLIAAGYFTEAGGTPAPGIARWDGASWYPLGAGINGYVGALEVCHDFLFAGGSFTDASGVPAINIARWDGASWTPVGSGIGGDILDPSVHALLEYDGSLFVGGWFTMAGGKPSLSIARWDDPATIAVPDLPRPSIFLLGANSPNPFSVHTKFTYVLPDFGSVCLTIHDIQGRLVTTLVNRVEGPGQHIASWDGRSNKGIPASAGVYFGRLAWQERVSSQRVVKLK